MGRAINLLKVRGSDHDKSIRFFQINDEGLNIGGPIEAIIGVLTGNPIIKEEEIKNEN